MFAVTKHFQKVSSGACRVYWVKYIRKYFDACSHAVMSRDCCLSDPIGDSIRIVFLDMTNSDAVFLKIRIIMLPVFEVSCHTRFFFFISFFSLRRCIKYWGRACEYVKSLDHT